jgi:hypothetical protein
MEKTCCDQLDDFLLGWLSPDEAAAFERHLAECPLCRRQCAQQKSIDGLLAEIGQSPDEVPAGLIESARNRLKSSRRRKALQWTLGLVAAAAVLTAAVFGRFVFQHSSLPAGQDIAVNNSTVDPLDNAKISTLVALTDPSEGIVLEAKTNNPKIKLVWIYPIVNADAASDGQSDE